MAGGGKVGREGRRDGLLVSVGGGLIKRGKGGREEGGREGGREGIKSCGGLVFDACFSLVVILPFGMAIKIRRREGGREGGRGRVVLARFTNHRKGEGMEEGMEEGRKEEKKNGDCTKRSWERKGEVEEEGSSSSSIIISSSCRSRRSRRSSCSSSNKGLGGSERDKKRKRWDEKKKEKEKRKKEKDETGEEKQGEQTNTWRIERIKDTERGIKVDALVVCDHRGEGVFIMLHCLIFPFPSPSPKSIP